VRACSAAVRPYRAGRCRHRRLGLKSPAWPSNGLGFITRTDKQEEVKQNKMKLNKINKRNKIIQISTPMGASDARRKTAHRTAPHCMGARRNARATRARACTRVRGPCNTHVKRRPYAVRGRAACGFSTHLGGGLPRENLPWATNNTRNGASTRPRMCARPQAHAHALKHTHKVTLTQAHMDTCADARACAQVNWRARN